MNDSLSPAERVVRDLLPDALVFSAPIARAVVARLRPMLGAEALRWVAASDTRWSGYCCHDHMAEVVLTAADEIEAGVDTVDPEAAAAALDQRRGEIQAEALRDFAADVADAEIARYDAGTDGWTACRNIADELRRCVAHGLGWGRGNDH